MTASDSVDPVGLLREQIEAANPDLLRAMVKTFAETLMSAEADAACGAPYGQRSADRVTCRNGYRHREWDTRAGTIELAIPKLRSGYYFPDWLLHRRRAEQALVSAVATSYLLGVSTRRVEKLLEQLGVAALSKSQVSEMAATAATVGSPAPRRRSWPSCAGVIACWKQRMRFSSGRRPTSRGRTSSQSKVPAGPRTRR
jgi:transposase-like protein